MLEVLFNANDSKAKRKGIFFSNYFCQFIVLEKQGNKQDIL